MGQIVYETLIDGLSLNIDENRLTVSSSNDLDMIFLNFNVDDKLCGIAIKKEEFKRISEFINKGIGELL